MKSYFAYIRVSTVKQGERGSSLQEQRAAIEIYARRNDLSIQGWFEEMETAAKQGRGAFNRMLGDLGRKRAAGIIIHKIDRGSRNLRDWARLGELMDRGIEVHFVHDNLDLTTRGGRLSADIQAVVAADYVRNLRDEVRKGIRGRLKQGYYPFPAPPGYLNGGSAKPKTIDPVKGPLVRLAFELYGSGNFSIQMLSRELAKRGLTTGPGRPLSQSLMARILHNQFYKGLMLLSSTGELFEGNHEPLVSPALFARVQAIMTGRLYPRTQIHRFAFRRLIKCGTCDRSLTGERQKGHVYYRCHSYACRRVSLSELDVEQAIVGELAYLQLDEQDIGDFREIIAEHEQLEDGQARERRKHSARELGLVEQRLERLTDALLDQAIDKEAYDARREALLTRRIELRDLAENGRSSTNFRLLAERFEHGFIALNHYKMSTPDEKRDILKTICSNLIAHQKTLTIPMLSPFAEMREWALFNNGAPHRRAARTPRRTKARRKRIRDLVTLLARTRTGIQTGEHGTTQAPAGRPDHRPLLPQPEP